MAATWLIDIKVLNLAEKRLSASAVRTDGEDVRNYRIVNTVKAKADKLVYLIKSGA